MFFSENELSLELLGVFKLTRGKYSIHSNNQRNYDSISLRIDGSNHFETKDNSFTVKCRDLLYLPKNAQYTSATDGETIFAIHFINYSFHAKNQIEIMAVDDIEYVENLVVAMYNNWKEKRQGYLYKCASIFYSLIHYLNCQSHEKMMGSISQDSRFKVAVDYIHTHFRSEQITVESLACMCSVSETYFRKIFRQIYGQSPSQYIINLRLECASQLLASRLYTIAEVSKKSGFSDTKYFSRLFKIKNGITPREFQQVIPKKMEITAGSLPLIAKKLSQKQCFCGSFHK